ncbi:hypothetical protein C4D60_Mb06t22710 [Musa balbisiana]|uniref:Uncharacterized protein n=1 Tax=Musa balbisiana TaxID=52838 RepID=A0A4S8IPX2_MUSBA|nr:hypothetical protein C4D60_Mb06t22710 [Musa balbisiana]
MIASRGSASLIASRGSTLLDHIEGIGLLDRFEGIDLLGTLGQPLYIDKAIAAQTRLAFAQACILVSSNKDLPNEVFYRNLDGNT